MSDDTLELKERISKLSDEELIEMVTVGADEYRQEALDYAKAELKYRRVDWSNAANPAEAEPVAESERDLEGPVINRAAATCVCGGALRSGTLVAERELTIIFQDNREERFIRVAACVECGQLSLVADYDTTVQ